MKTITADLYSGQHISEISYKATKTFGFLRRSLALAPRHTKEAAYKTLVRPQLEYAAPILHPDHDTQIGQVEKLPGGHAGDGETQLSVGDLLDELVIPGGPQGAVLLNLL